MFLLWRIEYRGGQGCDSYCDSRFESWELFKEALKKVYCERWQRENKEKRPHWYQKIIKRGGLIKPSKPPRQNRCYWKRSRGKKMSSGLSDWNDSYTELGGNNVAEYASYD